MRRIGAEKALIGGNLQSALIEIDSGKISKLSLSPSSIELKNADYHLASGILSPGLIDLQINGCFGSDFASATSTEWLLMLTSLASHGVTSIAPTIITAPIAEMVASIDRAKSFGVLTGKKGATRVLGFHVEGPYLSAKYRGAHEERFLKDPDHAEIQQFIDTQAVCLFTLAPERTGTDLAIKQLVGAGVVVSIGHSDASADDVRRAVDNGARFATHVYNAQRKPNDLDGGLAEILFAHNELHYGLIDDEVHVPRELVNETFKSTAGRVVLVTDAVSAMGMPPGEYLLGGYPIVLRAGDVARRLDGVMAGAVLALDEAVSNCINGGNDPVVALEAATRTPADLIGRNDLGRIEVGAQADLVWLSGPTSKLRATKTWIAGEEIAN